MTAEKHDRRILRTRELLIQALLDLLESKHYDKITVKDIVEQANIGRATFYAHYQNKDELLIGGFELMLDQLVQMIILTEDDHIHIDATMLFQHARGHFEIYRTLIWGKGFELLIQDGNAALSEKIEARLLSILSTQAPQSVPLPILAHTLSGTLLVLLKWWLDQRMPYTPEEMNAFFQTLVMPGIRASLG